MPIPDPITESVAVDNVKTIAAGPATGVAFYGNLAMANAVANQNLQQQEALNSARAMEVARLNAVHGGSKFTYELGAEEARANQKLLTGDSVAQQMQSLLAALNSGGQGVKSMGITPPPTA